MESFSKRMRLIALAIVVFGTTVVLPSGIIAAEENTEQQELMAAATSISISPVNKILQLEPEKVYEDSFNVSNNGTADMEFEVYSAPYAYSYSEEEKTYKLGFNSENTFTQIARWVNFKDTSGNWVEKAKYTAAPGQAVKVEYKITTPSSIPAGGQYAVLFAHTLSSTTTSSGIKTEASPGLVVYGRSNGETTLSGEISGLEVNQVTEIGGEKKNVISGKAKVKNNGNVDFMASGHLKVTGIFGNTYYETPSTSTSSRVSIIPETELDVSDVWEDTPYFGLFNVEWTVDAAGGTETITKQVLILPVPIIVLMILLLTIIIIWIIVIVRKRRERRARFSF